MKALRRPKDRSSAVLVGRAAAGSASASRLSVCEDLTVNMMDSRAVLSVDIGFCTGTVCSHGRSVFGIHADISTRWNGLDHRSDLATSELFSTQLSGNADRIILVQAEI